MFCSGGLLWWIQGDWSWFLLHASDYILRVLHIFWRILLDSLNASSYIFKFLVGKKDISFNSYQWDVMLKSAYTFSFPTFICDW